MKNKGFTLAEVLITLSIIGVVAALTIHSLLHKHKNEENMQRLKKAYSTITNAARLAMAKENVTSLADTKLGNKGNWGAGKLFVKDFLNSYFNVAQICDTDHTPCLASSYKALDGSTFDLPNFWQGACAVLADGTAICICNSMSENYFEFHSAVTVFIDVNGSKGPNAVGRDLFVADLYNDGKLAESYQTEAIERNAERCGESGYGGGGGCFTRVMLNGWKMDY